MTRSRAPKHPSRARGGLPSAAMHLRRALLLMGLVLLAVPAVGSPARVPRDRSGMALPAAPGPPAAALPDRTIAFRYPPRRLARSVPIAVGAHAIVRVASSRPGQVTLAGLGR